MKNTLKQKGSIHLMMWPQAIIAIHERFVGGERWSLKYLIVSHTQPMGHVEILPKFGLRVLVIIISTEWELASAVQ
jgi:hypothetical protein